MRMDRECDACLAHNKTPNQPLHAAISVDTHILIDSCASLPFTALWIMCEEDEMTLSFTDVSKETKRFELYSPHAYTLMSCFPEKSEAMIFCSERDLDKETGEECRH